MSADRAWIYLRKSRALGDPDDPKLLEHHHRALLRLARANELDIPKERVIREVGSAETIDRRPCFRSLLDQWERLPRGAGGVILITELERLSRGSMAERGRIAEALSRADIEILTPSRRYNLRSADDMFFFAIVSEMGGHELGKYKERKALKLEELLRQGRSPNLRPPFPYVRVGKPELTWRPHPQRFPIAQAWCEEVFSCSTETIAQKWGVRRWLVGDTLRNPAICGWPARRHALHHGERDWSFPSARLPREQWLWPEQPGDYEPVCDRETWEAIQQLLDARYCRRDKMVRTDDSWCRDLVRFVGCEDQAAHCNSRAAHPLDSACRLTYAVQPASGPLLYINRPAVHQAAEAALSELFAAPEVIAEALAAYRYARAAQASQPEGRSLETIAADRTRAEGRLVELLRREIEETSEIQRRAIERLRAETEREIRQLSAELQAVHTGAQVGPAVDALFPFLTEHLHELADWWQKESTTGTDKRRIANAFLARVLVVVEDTGGHAFRREVLRCELQPWLAELLARRREMEAINVDDLHFPTFRLEPGEAWLASP